MISDAGGRLMIGFPGTQVDPEFRERLDEIRPGAVILFARNLRSASQARDLIAEIRDASPRPLVLAVDQEGGAVIRLSRGLTVFPGNMALGAARSRELAALQGFESGRQLRALGFDLNLAPVVDLQTNPENPGIGIRSFGSARSLARDLAETLVRGHARSGVATCLKHFPGKGAASVDAHLDLPVLEATLAEFRDPHLRIFSELFEACRELPLAVMSTHLIVRGLDPILPATLSRRVIDEHLRGAMGFQGLVLTDCLEMGAIVKHWGVAEAAQLAAGAGHDLIPICHSASRQRAAASRLEAVLRDGRLDQAEHRESLRRIQSVAAFGKTPEDGPVATARGDSVARRIASSALCLFGDRRELIPIDPESSLLFVTGEPRALVGVEEDQGGDWPAMIRRAASHAGFRKARVEVLDGVASPDHLLREGENHSRVVFLGWNARGDATEARKLHAFCDSLGDRLIVVHLRNPFDQALVPEDITSVTTFGFREVQIESLMQALVGELHFSGVMPAEV